MVDLQGVEFNELVAQLAVPHRAKRAYWRLVLSGSSALPAIRRGMTYDNADVRDYCCKALDHLVDEDSFPELLKLLRDEDWRVRRNALHAIACDRCKDNVCPPNLNDVLPLAVQCLSTDPEKHVRAMAAEVVGRWVHANEVAEAALRAARDSDRDSLVRKVAGWYAPGGPIFRKTAPKTGR